MRQLRRIILRPAAVLLVILLLLLLAFTRANSWPAGFSTAWPELARHKMTPTGLTPNLDPYPYLDPYPWLYLRDDHDLVAGEPVTSVIVVGDMMLGRDVPADISPWSDVTGWLSAADLTVGNLESTLTNGTKARIAPAGEAQPIILRAEPAMAISMRQAGFDVLGLANNHTLDYGPAGLADTVGALHDAGLATVGAIGEDGVNRPLIRDINGVRLAFLAFNAVPDPHPDGICATTASCWPRPAVWEPVEGAKAIADARAQADAVIVSIHWGFEYEPRPDPFQESVAESMLAVGADLVVGHHPHVAQPIVVAGKQVIAYSLGNFVFDQYAGDTRQGLALRAFFDGEGLRAVQVLPIRAGTRPRLLALSEGGALLAQVIPPPRRVGFACDESSCTPAAVPQTENLGRFYGDQIDLTGDGSSETVRLEGERITIYEKGSAVWQSPAAWRVIDASLGDPNDDGRYEIMLAIWQRDEAGYERCQPYIVGHRGGEYTLLWGGRPVVDPIQELTVGDLDGDGTDELVVVEELADGSAQAVSVWSWTGWTFSLAWRSEYGQYRDLVLDEGTQTIISVVQASE